MREFPSVQNIHKGIGKNVRFSITTKNLDTFFYINEQNKSHANVKLFSMNIKMTDKLRGGHSVCQFMYLFLY